MFEDANALLPLKTPIFIIPLGEVIRFRKNTRNPISDRVALRPIGNNKKLARLSKGLSGSRANIIIEE